MKLTRRSFVTSALAAGVVAPSLSAESKPTEDGLKVRFLGTGAADWNGRDERGECRRTSSILLDGTVLVDYTSRNREMLPRGARPKIVFYTHSHGDHYEPDAAVRLGIERAYVHESWFECARRDFAEAAERQRKLAPEVLPLAFGDKVAESGIFFLSCPASHMTRTSGERTSFYLLEKGPTRLLYATDTGGIPAEAAVLAEIDAHRSGRGITALVMEATMGVGQDDDFRIFAHSSVAMVAQVARVLKATNRYRPRFKDQKIYLTHMARTLHGCHAEIAATAPAPLSPAYDGLEVVF